mgnify:CR=1 FL=1
MADTKTSKNFWSDLDLDDNFRNGGINPNGMFTTKPSNKKQLEKERIKQLQIARDGQNKINFTKGKKNYLWLISIGVAVLSYKFAKNKKEFYAFVGLLSPTFIVMAKSKYDEKMRVEKLKIQRERFPLSQA